MNAVEFLRAVWPGTGLYVIARGPFPGTTRPYFKHNGFKTIEEAGAFATLKSADNVFFTVHTLKGYIVEKQDGLDRARAKRIDSNMGWAKCYYSDIDCGPGKSYPDKNAGLNALAAFLEATGLPWPMVVSSGNGLHCYWILVDAIDSQQWRIHALVLKALAAYHGFQVDEAVTADTCRILRVVGTFNRKDPAKPLKIKVLLEQPTPFKNADFLALLDAAAQVLPAPEVTEQARMPPAQRPSPSDVAKVCPTFVKLVQDASTAPEPLWWSTNQLVLHTTGGGKLAHKIASQHPEYDFAETEAKLARLVEQHMGPPTCGRLQSLYGKNSPCPACANFGSPKSSPVVFARRLPTIQLPDEVPPPRLPYLRTKRGVEYLPPTTAAAPAQLPAQVISPYDLYPTMIVDELYTETKGIIWHAVVPLRGEIDFKLFGDIYHDEPRLLSALANRGVFIDKRNAKLLGGYMSHYIRLLQEQRTERTQFESFGWTPDYKQFVMADGALTAEGLKPALLSPSLANVAMYLHRKGTLEGQIKALEFYNHDDYVRQQFIIGASLGAALLWMTDHFGLIINLTGPSGASKSTALYAAMGLWGRGEKLTLDGGEDGATALGRAGRIRMMANLPVGVDEISLMPAEQIKRMAMAITQLGDRVGLKRSGIEKVITDTAKSTIMLCTSNSSAHALMSMNNQAGNAGSNRLLEIFCPKRFIHTKAEADAAVREFRAHYGHIGPIFIDHVLRNMDAVRAEVIKTIIEVDRRGRIDQQERFWSAGIGASVMGLRVGQRLKLLSYDPEKVLAWAISDQLSDSRRVVGVSYVDPIDVLHNYIDSIANNMLVVSQTSEGMGNKSKMVWIADREPRGALKARLEIDQGNLYLAPYFLREYCDQRKVACDNVIQELLQTKVISREKMKLSRHIPNYESGLAWTLKVDLNHEHMAGLGPIEVDNKIVHLYPSKKSDLT